MKQKWISGLLSSALLVAAVPMTALAAESCPPLTDPVPVLISETVRAFPDVPADHWAVQEIRRMVELGVMKPDEAGKFAPDQAVTRAEVVDALWRMSGKPVVNYQMNFQDVEKDSETAEAIRWSAAEKIAGGYNDESFGPENEVTREQLAAIIYRYVQKFDLGFKGMWMFHLNYTDADQLAEWAFEPMHWMVANHLMQGSGEELRLKGTLTRAQEAVILSRLLDVAAEKEVDFTQYASRGNNAAQ